MGWLAATLAAILIGYGVAGLAGGALPAHPDWRPPPPPAGRVEIFVVSNGVHTGLVVPKRAAGVDWRALFPAGDLADPRFGGWDHLAIGWGERTFYLETPHWADVRPATILAAALGSRRTLLHVEHVPRPIAAPDVRRILLRPAEYRRLAAFIRGARARDAARYPGYGRDDVFYESNGRYSALRTCNAWTGDALRHAGVRVGRWTPFPATLLWSL
ncbi:uncharacterized protein (TIGR02117 family) [Sphingomonas abaci]|uniref:Uncharacterized protein (TIGR02117 family) n=2 Tax=Sphingomonas abaci TaxID=237611 RepID=A0A7W7AHK2_9SPHN|nr:TIGR02117 family protein [Sphingomonas abaci]MBB4616394.1 uncharacterized protein (TIGR02117 family) [Sphingomonas abaci]